MNKSDCVPLQKCYHWHFYIHQFLSEHWKACSRRERQVCKEPFHQRFLTKLVALLLGDVMDQLYFIIGSGRTKWCWRCAGKLSCSTRWLCHKSTTKIRKQTESCYFLIFSNSLCWVSRRPLKESVASEILVCGCMDDGSVRLNAVIIFMMNAPHKYSFSPQHNMQSILYLHLIASLRRTLVKTSVFSLGFNVKVMTPTIIFNFGRSLSTPREIWEEEKGVGC